jgi:aspartate-semialdehyde dehydrogenase
MSINAEFDSPVSVSIAREAIEGFSGSELKDDPSNLVYPMPIDYSEKVSCGIGRIRKDTALNNGLALWVVGDQLWKGAALNAVQISEVLLEYGHL